MNKKTDFPLITIILTIIITITATTITLKYSGFFKSSNQVLSDDSGHQHDTESETLYTCSMHPFIITKEKGDCPVCGMELILKAQENTKSTEKKVRKIAFWKAPMNPAEIYKEPGKSVMGMALVPVYEDEIKGGVEITIDPVTQQNMGVRTAVVKKSNLEHTIRAFGHITYDETKTFKINPRYSGWVEKLYVNFKGQMVKKGENLFTVYSPELVTAEEEYLEAFRNYKKVRTDFNKRLLRIVKSKLVNYGLSSKEIKRIESNNKAENVLTIRTNIFAVSDLSKIWVEAHIYEYELSRIKKGLPAEMSLPYLPGKTFGGAVKYIYPYLQKETRDIVILIEFDNADFSLQTLIFKLLKLCLTD